MAFQDAAVPYDYDAALRSRVMIRKRCEESMEYRAACLALCHKDPVFWINNFAWTYDPRLSGHSCWLPFLLWPIQDEFVAWAHEKIESGRSFGVEKSRDMGATWMILALIVWGWLFQYGYTAKIGSLDEDMVYKKDDPDALFTKMEFLVETLPSWMKPEGWGKACITFMKMTNPQNSAVINGKAPVPNFGRGGRCKFIFFDEIPHWAYGQEAWNSASQTANSRCANGTPNGMGNIYGRMMNPDENVKGPRLPKFILDWHDDPRKNHYIVYDLKPTTADIDTEFGELTEEYLAKAKVVCEGNGWAKEVPRGGQYVHYPWYVYQTWVVFQGDVASIAAEIDRDYKRSVKGRVYNQVEYVRKGRYFYNEHLPTYASWDFGLDTTAIGWYQWDYRTRRYSMIDYVEKAGVLIDWFIPFFTGKVPQGMAEGYLQEEKEKIRSHDGWKIDGHFGDPSGNQTSAVVDISIIDVLDMHGIEVTTNSYARTFSSRITSSKRLLLRLNVDEVNCKKFLQAMENYRWPKRAENANFTGTTETPVHDKYSHGATQFEYLAVNDPHKDDMPRDPKGDMERDDVVRNWRRHDGEERSRDRGITGYGKGC